MKNLVFNLAIALVVIAYVGGVFESKKEGKTSGNSSTIVTGSKHREIVSVDLSASAIGNNPKNVNNKAGIASIRIERIIAADNEISTIYYPKETKRVFFEEIDNIAFNKTGKTIDEIIAEDNAITGNNPSDEKEAADVINANPTIDAIAFNKTGKTIDEIIAEDNAITGNDSFNEKATDLSNASLSIDNIVFDTSGKTIEEIIAQDKAVTENNFSNEVMVLDYK